VNDVSTSLAPGTSLAGCAAVAEELRTLLGRGAVLTDPAALRAYDCDGLTTHRVTPGLVVLAADADAVAAAVAACHRRGVPFVARGSGTGLSGGATPHADGVLIVTSRMRRVWEIDPANRRAVVEPGVTNLDVTRAAAPHGLYFAPDPSSQQVCSIGGNVAENSGGAHCLKYGFTVHHVTGLDVVLPDGTSVELGGKAAEYPGYDLVGAFVGSEGTLGVATRVTLRLLRAPEAVKTLLAAFRNVDDAGAAVSAIIAAGVVPAAVEMMDALAVAAVEEAVACGYPAGAAAILIVELDGPSVEVEAEFAEVGELCARAGAFELRTAADAAERALIWKGRKSAFAAMGRISPHYYVQDGVIPRTALPEVLRRISGLADDAGVRVANVFHAGDGNLHPLVLYDGGTPGEAERAERVATAILELCVAHGGSITGEHGVGLDKKASLGKMFSADDLATMQLLRCAFDPAGLANPGKVFPTPRMCGEAPGPRAAAHLPTGSTPPADVGQVF
jgi:glycolate oxidase